MAIPMSANLQGTPTEASLRAFTIALVLVLRLHGADNQEGLHYDLSQPQAPGYVSKRHKQATTYVPSGHPLGVMAGPLERWPPQQESRPAPRACRQAKAAPCACLIALDVQMALMPSFP